MQKMHKSALLRVTYAVIKKARRDTGKIDFSS